MLSIGHLQNFSAHHVHVPRVYPQLDHNVFPAVTHAGESSDLEKEPLNDHDLFRGHRYSVERHQTVNRVRYLAQELRNLLLEFFNHRPIATHAAHE